MRAVVTSLLVAMLAIATPAVAARRRTAVQPDALTLTFDSDHVDAGTIVHDFERHITSVTRRVVLRADRPGRGNRGVALLSAARETDDPRFIVRVDGVELHGELLAIATIPLGTATTHRIEIIVPADADEGALMTNIRWEISTP
jgi:hypothetical protein